ncbi:ABC-type lipoprotein export system ATPase subunit [Natranaerovirga hydrolytica]|uniref:ABC-type lipoprotein export system ATPase subunit n=1 Tax=Natranaerovirga hydrolytica TaxID=680378 RepID=A0A4R1ML58_9FIRM|nr:ATP-binding cassette domain-containing protein [Natranaerovirga hydrolytica]TCK93327.1 ABC-type lipoprotein export system ATPase subunit [Natranaerovirga hydrolytica]
MMKSYKDMFIQEIITTYPYAKDFFNTMGIPLKSSQETLMGYINNLDAIELEHLGIEHKEVYEQFEVFMQHMEEIKKGIRLNVESITILGGYNKLGEKEKSAITMHKGEIICIVGPTGAGKSRLLADIEWMAQKDTPTHRQILINGQVPPKEWRFSLEHKLVAQLSQNMNFVMDLSVYEFIQLHAESRMVDHPSQKALEIIEQANLLAGEKFDLETPITALSGGQSRALMISDTAFLSISPIVLIDEIENAGIDRKKALELLVKKDKIVLMVTHDPILALMGEKRLVIKNGGIYKTLTTTKQEKDNLKNLEEMDQILFRYREQLRKGETIDWLH